MNKKPLIFDLSKEELNTHLLKWGEKYFRTKQIWQGLYQHLWETPDEFTNLSKDLRARLSESFSFSSLSKEIELSSKDDETQKMLFRLPDGNAIETVLMKYEKRRTLCISTQVGCAMGCVFCATGQMGFKRNLSSGEIIEQVIYFARQLLQNEERLTNIVYMGMGEPFHNYEATMDSFRRLNLEEGFNLGARRFTVSTVGIIPAIERFAKEKTQMNLAISLHSADNAKRSEIIPINKKYNLEQLIDACKYYIEQSNRRITFEWALIEGITDTPAQARLLGELLKGLLCHVNIIPLNPTDAYSGKKPNNQRVQKFREILISQGIPCSIRVRRGIDIHAGCGQLASTI